MSDIKPDYYVDDNYREWAYDEDSDDELNECWACGEDMDECVCEDYPRCQEENPSA